MSYCTATISFNAVVGYEGIEKIVKPFPVSVAVDYIMPACTVEDKHYEGLGDRKVTSWDKQNSSYIVFSEVDIMWEPSDSVDRFKKSEWRYPVAISYRALQRLAAVSRQTGKDLDLTSEQSIKGYADCFGGSGQSTYSFERHYVEQMDVREFDPMK